MSAGGLSPIVYAQMVLLSDERLPVLKVARPAILMKTATLRREGWAVCSTIGRGRPESPRPRRTTVSGAPGPRCARPLVRQRVDEALGAIRTAQSLTQKPTAARVAGWVEARFSKSLARRLFRPSQEK